MKILDIYSTVSLFYVGLKKVCTFFNGIAFKKLKTLVPLQFKTPCKNQECREKNLFQIGKSKQNPRENNRYALKM